jgi:hypothetical protein
MDNVVNPEPERQVTLAARVPPDLAQAVRALAAEGDRTVSREIGRAIREHVQSENHNKHKSKQPPNFVSPKGKASGGRKNVIGPGPRPGGKQPPSAQGDYLLKQQQGYEKE